MTTFLQSLTEQYDVVQHADVQNNNYLMPLSQLGVLEIKGDDASTFLQNMLTNDVNALAVNQSQLSGFCNAKGRLLALFLLIRRSDYFQIILPKSMCASLLQRLTLFKLRSKVSIIDVSNDFTLVGLTQGKNEKINYIDLPEQNFQTTEHDNNLFLKLPSSINRYLLLTESTSTKEICQNLLNQSISVANEASWQLLDIEIGLATVLPETKEKFTPQQLNFDLVGGISFNKGCYPGQEIVARLHYLGKPSRRLFSANCICNDLPIAGLEVTDQDGTIVGHVVTAQFCTLNDCKLLLSLKLADCDKKLFIHNSIAMTKLLPLAAD